MNAWTLSADGTQVPVADELELEEGTSTCLVAPDAVAVWLGARALKRHGAGWEIPVGYWVSARSLALRIEGPGGRKVVATRVRPAASKLSADQWGLMVDDVESFLAGASLGEAGGTDGSVETTGPADGVRIEVLTTLVGPLLRALEDLVQSPRYRDATATHPVRLSRMRRLDGAGTLAVARGLDEVSSRVGVDRLDHPANRWISARVREAQRAFAAAAARLAQVEPADALDEDRVAWARARGARCSDAAEALRRLLQDTFLGALPPGGAGESVLPTLLGDPRYARAHRLLRVLLSPRFRLDGSGPGAAVRHSYSMWELWCFRQVVAEEAAARPGWTRTQALAPLRSSTGSGASVTLTNGNDRVVVRFNPTFALLAPGGRFSLTRELRPDITIHERADGGARWWVYDAKWRVGRRALGEGFDSVHRYRDALVDEAFGGRAAAAWLIAPSAGDAPQAWLDPEWQRRWGMGVRVRVPGQVGPTRGPARP